MTAVAFSCLLDDDPIQAAQAFLWVNCLKRLQQIHPADIFVHTTVVRSQLCDWLSAEKVNVVQVEPFDRRSPYCNKIQQLASFCHARYDQVVFMDCDTAWIGKERLPFGTPVSARIVDYANPPEPILRKIFSTANLGSPYWWPVGFPKAPDREFTDANNCNGGLYICEGAFVAELAPCWRRWAAWCLNHSQLFDSFSMHADQVSFALAMRECNARVHHLPLHWNYPTHILEISDLPDVAPQIIHYHREVTGHLKLKTIGVPAVDHVISELNTNIARFIADSLLNAVFWEFRYRIDPQLGSGVSSRGSDLEKKRRLVADALGPFEDGRIVDVGCGDLEVTRQLPVKSYLGLDPAKTAIAVARGKRPDWDFQLIQLDDPIPEGKVVLCIDVLIHQPDEREFLNLIERLVRAARWRLIVTGYEHPPTFTSEITRYYLPITEALQRTHAFASIAVVGHYRDVVMVVAEKADPTISTSKAEPTRTRVKTTKIIVGSGWWCDRSTHDWALGSPVARSTAFFDLWYRQVLECLQPKRIVVTDSASPLKPDLSAYNLVQWITLDRNYGHANDLRSGRIHTKYSGFTRSVINGAMYALCCDADIYVYVEQDCLLHGEDFLEHAIGDSQADILLGAPPQNGRGLDGAVAAPMLQQSLMVVRRAGLERFLIGLLGATAGDGEVSPEETMRTKLVPFDFLRVPYGRERPIDFDRTHFYAQHLDDEELAQFISKFKVSGNSKFKVPGNTGSVPAVIAGQTAGDPSDFLLVQSDLGQELQKWELAEKKARFWWRDDDAVSDTLELRRLLGLAKEIGTVVGLAVIPGRADDTLAKLVAGAPCCIWQHGWRHHWQHEERGQTFSQGEFGEGRDLASMVSDARSGQIALDNVFGRAGWQQVFVPPFHALSVPFKMLLPSLGYWGLSAGHPVTPPIHTVVEVNAEVDIMNWPKRKFLGSAAITKLVVEQLKLRRQGQIAADTPVGLLTHHLVMGEDAWRFMREAFRFLKTHRAAEIIPASQLFKEPSANLTDNSRVTSNDTEVKEAGKVTVIITSCGRQDLLEITLDSFLEHNTFPIAEFIVVEDGDKAKNEHLIQKYCQYPFKWLATGRRVGQVAAIDIAYQAVHTEFVFHCEDDWRFYASGFIEKSLTVLKHNPSVLQVWLRSLDDTNHHPVLGFLLMAGGVPYKLLGHYHDAGEWGMWHGLSWNPGLRRLRDYRLLGSFRSLDPNRAKETWQVESEASAFYQRHGFFAAILVDNGGRGYVRHIGASRRVPRNCLGPQVFCR